MGTKLEYAVVNLLPASSKELSIADEWGACLKTQSLNKDNSSQTVHNLRHSMDRMLDKLHSLDSIKNVMLQHDHLFKQQVKELHRLYSVQKMLMTDLANRHNDLQTPVLSSTPSFKETSGQNLTNGRCFDLEQAAYEEEETEIELTLSIGNMENSKKPSSSQTTTWTCYSPNPTSDPSEVKQQEECRKNTATSDQARKRPHWLSHSLSLHKT